MKKREEEMEAVRTTIVGGRPPGCGRRDTGVPRGIEVLVKKAAVDEEFRGKLLAQRGAAAAEIGLELDPAESAMLGVIAEEQLARIIRQTVVPTEQLRVFMGTVAAAMLAVLGVGLASCQQSDSKGAQAGAPGQASNPQSLPQGEVIKGLRAAPAETSTQTAPTTPATGNTTPPNPPMVVFGLRREPPPATSTQPATAPGDASPTPPADLPRPVAGLMAPRPPTTSTQPAPSTSTDPASAPADATSTVPPAPPFAMAGAIAGLMAPRPPATSTEPAPPATGTKPAATDTAPATTSTRRGYGTVPGGGGFGGTGPARN